MAVGLPPSGDPGEERYVPLAEINVTPMVDVMLVLLVIFMVAAPLLTVGVPINLPKTSAAQVTVPQEPIVVSMNQAGDTFIGDKPALGDDLRLRWRRFGLRRCGRRQRRREHHRDRFRQVELRRHGHRDWQQKQQRDQRDMTGG